MRPASVFLLVDGGLLVVVMGFLIATMRAWRRRRLPEKAASPEDNWDVAIQRISQRRALATKDPVPGATAPSDAYQFASDLTLEAMQERLNQATVWHWREGDSGWLGDYLAAEIVPGGSLRLYQALGSTSFVIEMRRDACSETSRALILDEILPLLEAHDIAATEGFD